jgi:hypothetical protein
MDDRSSRVKAMENTRHESILGYILCVRARMACVKIPYKVSVPCHAQTSVHLSLIE